MDNLEKLLTSIQKTNPTMSKERLIEELSKSRYSTISLITIWQNSEKFVSKQN